MKITEAPKFRVDLHLHTGASIDVKKKRQTNEAIIKKAIKRGLDGFIVSDHDTVKGYKPLAEQALDHGLIVIPGVEVTCLSQPDLSKTFLFPGLKPIKKKLRRPHIPHLVIAGVTSESKIPTFRTPEEAARWGQSEGGKIFAAHPKRKGGITSLSEREVFTLADMGLLDGIEVTNSNKGHIREYLIDWTRETGLPEIGGSDAHDPKTIGLAATEISGKFKDWQDVLSAIKTGNTRAYVSEEFTVYRRNQKHTGSIKGLTNKAWDAWCEHVA